MSVSPLNSIHVKTLPFLSCINSLYHQNDEYFFPHLYIQCVQDIIFSLVIILQFTKLCCIYSLLAFKLKPASKSCIKEIPVFVTFFCKLVKPFFLMFIMVNNCHFILLYSHILVTVIIQMLKNHRKHLGK